MGIRKIIYGLLQLGAESTATTQTTAVIQSLSGSLALVPQGVGAITAQIPDGTVAGGNARGANAVDLQMLRTLAAQVASGQESMVLGGNNNRASGYHSIAGGGQNTATGYTSIALGENCQSNGQLSVSLGGANTASSNYSTVSGGQNNTASTNTHATVVGGYSNTASGQYSVAGGNNNTVSALSAVVMGGNNTANNQYAVCLGGPYSTASGGNTLAVGWGNVASGDYSVALNTANAAQGKGSISFAGSNGAGNGNTSSGERSISMGGGALAYLPAQQALSSTSFVNTGDAQQSLLTAKKSAALTTAQTASLSLDGTGTTNLIIPNGSNRTWNTTVNWVATVTGSSGTTTGVTVGDSIYGVSEFGFKVSASIASITPLIRDSIVADTTIMETATLTYATGSSNSLAMTFTAPTFAGGGSLGMRVVAKVSLVELGW